MQIAVGLLRMVPVQIIVVQVGKLRVSLRHYRVYADLRRRRHLSRGSHTRTNYSCSISLVYLLNLRLSLCILVFLTCNLIIQKKFEIRDCPFNLILETVFHIIKSIVKMLLNCRESLINYIFLSPYLLDCIVKLNNILRC